MHPRLHGCHACSLILVQGHSTSCPQRVCLTAPFLPTSDVVPTGPNILYRAFNILNGASFFPQSPVTGTWFIYILCGSYAEISHASRLFHGIKLLAMRSSFSPSVCIVRHIQSSIPFHRLSVSNLPPKELELSKIQTAILPALERNLLAVDSALEKEQNALMAKPYEGRVSSALPHHLATQPEVPFLSIRAGRLLCCISLHFGQHPRRM